jgi:shikimate dehydrogenase
MSAPSRAGVCGWPVAHSRSPLIHGYWLRRYGLAGAYERFAIAPPSFADFVTSIGRDGLVGCNVTAPHKEAAYAACQLLSDAARATGAVNTLWREDAALCGDNTDVQGFLGSLDTEAPGWRERAKHAVVLGAGGAARAIVYGLKSRGLERIVIVNRSGARAEALVERFGPTTRAAGWETLPGELARAGLLVNTTTLGMAGQPPLELDLAPLTAGAVVADIVYTPLATKLVAAARTRGLVAVGGLGMLLRQAAPGFARWFGKAPEVTMELRKLIEDDLNASGSGDT